MKFKLHLLFSITFTLLVSCFGDDIDISSNPPAEEENTQTGTRPNVPYTFGIRHDLSLADYEAIGNNEGEFTPPTYPDFSPVVRFSFISGVDLFLSSGVLIDSEWVLTAGHNFYFNDTEVIPSNVTVSFGNDPANPEQTQKVESLHFFPTWKDNDLATLYGNDFCLVKLASPVSGVTPAQINFSPVESIGAKVWHSAFGLYPRTERNVNSKRHAMENILDRKGDRTIVTANNSIYTGGILAFDFDDPSGQINSLGDDYLDFFEENIYGTGSSDSEALDYEGTSVSGDSGGPLFMYINGSWKVTGILSGGVSAPVNFEDFESSDYGDISIFSRTSSTSTSKWIQETIANN